jgi:hypothetical protein
MKSKGQRSEQDDQQARGIRAMTFDQKDRGQIKDSPGERESDKLWYLCLRVPPAT